MTTQSVPAPPTTRGDPTPTPTSSSLLGRLSIGMKLTIGFGVLVALIFLGILLSYLGSVQATTAITRTRDVRAPSALISARAQANLYRMLAGIRGYLALGDPELRENYTRARQQFESDIVELRDLASQSGNSETVARLDSINALLESMEGLPEQMFELRDDPQRNQPALRVLAEQGEPLIQAILTNTSVMLDEQAQREPTAANMALLKDMADFQGTFSTMVASLRGYLATGNGEFKLQYENYLAANREAWDKLVATQEDLTPEQNTQLQAVALARNRFLPLPWMMYSAIESERSREDLYLLRTRAEPLAMDLLQNLNAVASQEQRLLQEDLAAGSNRLLSSQNQLLTGGVIALVVAMIMSTVFRRNIIGAIRRLTGVAARIEAGDLTALAPVDSKDELGTLAVTFNEMTSTLRRTLQDLQSRTEDVERHSVQLQVAAEVARDTLSAPDLATLLSRAVNLVRDRFGFYHAGLFLVDGDYAVLTAATGEAGRAMLAQNHRLKIGEVGIVGYVTASGQPRIALDVGGDAVHFKNPFLPETRSEMALPLKVSDQIIGALDVQSREASAFDQEDVTVLQTMADQLAIAIENARAYERQIATAAKLRELDELKTQFIANMSHELRTPLNSIIGFSRVILKGIDGPITDLQRKDLSTIHTSGQHLLGLINDILDISKIEAGKMEMDFDWIDLRRLIEGTLSTTTGLVKDKSIQLRSQIPEGLPQVRADATRVRQVLLNLLSNSAKFTDEGEIRVIVEVVGDAVHLSVADTGLGIPANKMDRLFEAFYQVDGSATRRVGGSGLGLAISRHFVEMHGGEIWVESREGQGTTFTFSLPIQGPRTLADESKGPPAAGPLVLVADAEPAITAMYARYLEPEGYRVMALNDGGRVVTTATEQRPQALVVDLRLPGQSGLDIVSSLKARPETAGIPVIITSVEADDGESRAAGAAAHLVKPILRPSLLGALATLNDNTHTTPVS